LEALQGWGLEARIKKFGKCSVYGVGSYSFDDTATNTPKIKHDYDNLYLAKNPAFLRNKVRFFSERTKFKWQSDWKQEK
jgi:hypothetical protein